MRAATLDRLLSTKRTNIRWDSDEWEELAKRVWKRRARHPEENLILHVNAVQKQQEQPGCPAWPEDRRRTITTMAQIEALFPLLRQLDLDMIELRDRTVPSLQDSIEQLRQRPDKEQLLAQLCPQEIVRRFTDPVFENLPPAEIIGRFNTIEILSCISPAEIYGYLGQAIFNQMGELELRLAGHLVDHQNAGAVNGKTHHALTKAKNVVLSRPKIAIVGMQQRQLELLMSHVGTKCEIIYIAKGVDDFNQLKPDHVILWETYVSGNQKQAVKKHFHGDRLSIHKGTLNQMVPLIERLPVVSSRAK